MTRSTTVLALAAAMLACGPTTQFVGGSADEGGSGGGAETGGGRGDEGGDASGDAEDGTDGDATGSLDPDPAGDGCDADDCAPEVLWIHEVATLTSNIGIDASGRPLFFTRAEPEYHWHVVAYDPALDVEEVVGEVSELVNGLAATARDGPGGLRVLTPFGAGAGYAKLTALDDFAWSQTFADELQMRNLDRGPDGTSYVTGFADGSERVDAYAVGGELLWSWTRWIDEGEDGSSWGDTVAVHDAGVTLHRLRYYGPELGHVLTRVENDAVVDELDITGALGSSRFETAKPFDGGWLVLSADTDGNGLVIGKLDATGGLEWSRRDSAMEDHLIMTYAATDDRILVASKPSRADATVQLRSYERDGRLRGATIVDLAAYTDQVDFDEDTDLVSVLPDGTMLVCVRGREGSGSLEKGWLVGVRP